MAYIEACKTADLPQGEKKRVKLNGESVLVYHLEDGYYATQNNCPHTLGPLHRGKIKDGCRITCPLHRAEFDIRTGAVEKWANFPPGVQLLNAIRGEKPLKTYSTQVEGGSLMVDV